MDSHTNKIIITITTAIKIIANIVLHPLCDDLDDYYIDIEFRSNQFKKHGTNNI